MTNLTRHRAHSNDNFFYIRQGSYGVYDEWVYDRWAMGTTSRYIGRWYTTFEIFSSRPVNI